LSALDVGRGRWTLGLLFASTLFGSSALLFVVEPLVGKSLLPALGGGAAVWTTAAAFFQLALLAGYLYAHALSRRGDPRRLAWVHVAIVVAAALTFAPAALTLPAGTTHPGLWLFGTLARTVGVPFVLLAASTPLLHSWLAATAHASARDPYFLFAASNAGSLLALLAYPAVIEPALGLSHQRRLWSLALFALAALLAACATVVRTWRPLESPRPSSDTVAPAPAVPWRTRLRWLALAAVPSSLLLSVTSHATADVAALPLLWILPLALYLATFILAFARRPLISPARVLALQPFFFLLVGVQLFMNATGAAWPLIPVHGVAFFLIALGSHQALAASRPPAERSTEFYLWLAAGGALGGLFNVFVAPLAFSTLLEYPLGLVAAALLRAPAPLSSRRDRRLDVLVPLGLGAALLALTLVGNHLQARPYAGATAVLASLGAPLMLGGVAIYACRGRALRFGLALAALCAVGTLHQAPGGRTLLHARSFYGVHTVTDRGSSLRTLSNGATVHGAQSLDPARRREPLTYYHPTGPIGDVMEAWRGQPLRRRVGLVGLGAGALATYSAPGEHWTFFELDPAVIDVARDRGLFTYLADARGTVDVVEGDARRTLADAPDASFGLLVLDAFSSDAVPAHLLTREALGLYLRKLAPGGVAVFHLSNHFIDIEPVVAGGARALGLASRARADQATRDELRAGKSSSLWMAVARDAADLAPLVRDPRWRPARGGVPAWTDDKSDLWSSLHLRATEVFDFDALSR
jgi:SAM-dependent methyltransferase